MTLYEQDFYQWTQQQAGLLKAGRWREIDREHLVEENETQEHRSIERCSC